MKEMIFRNTDIKSSYAGPVCAGRWVGNDQWSNTTNNTNAINLITAISNGWQLTSHSVLFLWNATLLGLLSATQMAVNGLHIPCCSCGMSHYGYPYLEFNATLVHKGVIA